MAEQGVETERQLVVFDLAEEVYGVEINTVREIIRMQAVTSVPDAPAFVEGVMNLRGSVIPVVMVDIDGEGIGVIVDAVTEVLRVTESSIEPASSVISTEDSYYIQGIAKLSDRLLILLDIEKALGEEAGRTHEAPASAISAAA